jgi:hypothetical protein
LRRYRIKAFPPYLPSVKRTTKNLSQNKGVPGQCLKFREWWLSSLMSSHTLCHIGWHLPAFERKRYHHLHESSCKAWNAVWATPLHTYIQHRLAHHVPMILCILNSSVSDTSPHTWAPRLWPTHVVLCCCTPLLLMNVNNWETHRATGFMLCTAAA